MTEEELLAEEYICNGKCQDDITRNYVHCKTCTRLKDFLAGYKVEKTDLEKENAELRKVAEFQQSSNMSRHFENKKLKEGLAVGSTFNKALNSMNKNLIEERDKYRNMVFDKAEQLTKAKEIIKDLLSLCEDETDSKLVFTRAEQFLSEVGK